MPGAVRNRGAEAARGAYLAFLDSDDLWSPEKLEKQIARMFEWGEDTSRMYTCRVSHTRERWLRRAENGEFREISQKGQKHRRSGDIFEDALKKCIIGPSTVMMERSFFEELGGFREELEIAEDYEFWLRITALEEVGYLDGPLTVKRAGYGDQLSEKYGHIEYFRLTALKALIDSGWFADKRRTAACLELARKCRIYAAGCRKRGRGEEALQYERWAEEYQREAARPDSAQSESAP
jgi:glycosyltransferase involved in cell wall biosynthesis